MIDPIPENAWDLEDAVITWMFVGLLICCVAIISVGIYMYAKPVIIVIDLIVVCFIFITSIGFLWYVFVDIIKTLYNYIST